MKVYNSCTFPIKAFGFHVECGYGVDVLISARESLDVSGPYLGEMGGGDCYVVITGEITCHESPDDDNGFQVLRGHPLSLQSGDVGITVRHYEDETEECVQEWRRAV